MDAQAMPSREVRVREAWSKGQEIVALKYVSYKHRLQGRNLYAAWSKEETMVRLHFAAGGTGRKVPLRPDMFLNHASLFNMGREVAIGVAVVHEAWANHMIRHRRVQTILSVLPFLRIIFPFTFTLVT
eukprot:scaffold17030_cov86-Skeletonema_marinoi.AAC.1